MNNAELIADLQSNIVGDPFPLMRKAADAIEALEAEVERLTTLAHGQHIELYNARLQLAAAQGQLQQYDEALCTVAEQRDTMKLHIRQHLANRYAYTFKEFCEKLEEILYAAPIPQQPSVPEGWKLVPIEPTEAMLEVGFFAENDVFDSAKTKRIHVWKDMIAAAPQPKEKQ